MSGRWEASILKERGFVSRAWAFKARHIALLLVAATFALPAVGPNEPVRAAAPAGEEFLVVDCLLPGRIKKLGSKVTFLTPRRPIRTSARECEIRGGEYVSYDRADFGTSLQVWRTQAENGDTAAQHNVGMIYERGFNDYESAAQWYRRAAQSGYRQSQVSLGRLYEKGLGVARDTTQALQWYQRASGLTPAEFDTASRVAESPEVRRLRAVVRSLGQKLRERSTQLFKVRAKLEDTENAAATERLRVEELRKKLEDRRETTAKNKAEWSELEAQFRSSQEQLARRDKEIEKLKVQAQSLGQETKEDRQQIVAIFKDNSQLLGPEIRIHEPLLDDLGATRSLTRARALASNGRILVRGTVVSTVLLDRLVINGENPAIDTNINEFDMVRGMPVYENQFEISLALAKEDQTIKVVAVDRQRRHAEKSFHVPPSVQQSRESIAEMLRSSGMDLGRYHAMIIGNEHYDSFTNVKTARNDAVAIAEILEGQYGFQVELKINATRYEILKALNNYRETLRDKDNLLIYFAGHGFIDRDRQIGYWLPADARPEDPTTWISAEAVTDVVGIMDAMHVLIVADSSYSGQATASILANLSGGVAPQARVIWLRSLSTKRSRTVLTSGSLAPVPGRNGDDHSVFAKTVLETLAENRDVMEGNRFFQRISARLSTPDNRVVKQTARYAPLMHGGHELGDFVFVPGAL